ncbi:ABC transporter ATP-binding protein [Marinactinospora thermotolerans]|uniref:ABC-2 type transport system ATP-binding protein n=1 Tax=Marinactinospora thermotolerans DSM 45154 TaxID=1122192 RepID=A0A1T4M1G2_9ACTN|nr:ATP-binding cassette domain-containing protein [Marinactinospora thermotolerans]SJZ60727.1 ABC-2 type transport system ATP-binding protein [Marinactinospora thermotolerans DSM 45154]
MITFHGLTKRYGDRIAVDGLTCEIASGRVTGVLGPNGAGKSTTMRMLLGLDAPSAGRALIDGRPYAALRHPLREVGALLDARAVHPGLTARAHLLALARGNGIAARRVEEVLETVGLARVARRRVGTFSLGMSQRLGIAGALLGDPRVLVLDEPVNGLDPDGVRWIRRLMRSLAGEGRAVLVSSHLMSEMQETADHLIVLGRGRLIADAPLGEIIARSTGNSVRVRTPRAAELVTALTGAGMQVRWTAPEELRVTGAPIERIGLLAHEAGVPLHELSPRTASLEHAYLELTASSVAYAAPTPDTVPAAEAWGRS